MGQCIRRPDPVSDTQTSLDSLQPFNQVDLKMNGAILPLPATGPTLKVAVNDDGYGTLETVRGRTTRPSSKKPVKRVTFNPQVQVQEFQREIHERIRLIIIPDSDSLESPVPPRVRVARRKPRQNVATFKWDDVLSEVYGQPLAKNPSLV